MPTINELDSVTTVNADDKVPLYSSTNGDARKASMSALSQFFQGQLTGTGFYTQRAAPIATSFTVQIAAPVAGSNVWLLLKQPAPFADGTVLLPLAAECVDGQEFLLSCTQSLTNLTVAGNGASVLGAPATLAANAFFRLKFDLIDNTWYRVG